MSFSNHHTFRSSANFAGAASAAFNYVPGFDYLITGTSEVLVVSVGILNINSINGKGCKSSCRFCK